MLTCRFFHRFLITALSIAIFLPSLIGSPARALTAAQFLAQTQAPQFRPGNTLPRLTRWGWWMSYDTRIALCQHWGYGLEWVDLSGNDMNDPTSIASQVCALSASDPKDYPLFVILPRPFQYTAFTSTLPESAWCHDATGARLTHYSPVMPDSVYQAAAAQSSATVASIHAVCPISIVLNGGEYGLDVDGFGESDWAKDPAVLAAKGSLSWFDFISQRKAHYESIVMNATKAAAPEMQTYLFYPSDGGVDRNRYAGWWQWVWEYSYMSSVNTYPNSSLYFDQFNTGWTGSIDMLTQTLNATASQIAQGDPLSYNWVCEGWLSGQVSDDPHYMGYLKCLYTSGMIGAVAGYFTYPTAGFTGDVGTTAPNWLTQMEILAHAHGLFTYLEDFLRNGSLQPGPNHHIWSTDLPAYEFPTGDATARVLARKLNNQNEWLICAWAAGGADRQVTVTIPKLGTVNVLARSTGTIYRAKPGPVLIMMDSNGMQPSLGLNNIQTSCGPNGAISSSANVAVPAGGSETITFSPNPGYQVSAVQIDGRSVGTGNSYTFTNVTANHTLYVTFAPVPPATYTLSVTSQPAGIVIQGTPSGVTQYTARLTAGTGFSLTAPAQATVNGKTYAFVNWIDNGVNQPNGQTTLQDTPHTTTCTAQAIYKAVSSGKSLTVQNRSFTTPENQGFPFVLTATNGTGTTLTYTIVTQPAHGFVGAGGTPGQYFYMPKPNFSGTDTFTYMANDGIANSNVATVTITVIPVQ